MRRISLALALLGAVAATGCGAGAKKSSDTGAAPGVAQGTFTVTIQNGLPRIPAGQPNAGQLTNPSLAIKDGKVVSTTPAALIDCGVGGDEAKCVVSFALGSTVVLEAQPAAGKAFLGWAGDCSGDGLTCTLSGNADKYIVAQFGDPGSATGHANWADGRLHGAKYRAYQGGDLSWDCKKCHGETLQGVGIAVSCYSCHGLNNHKDATGKLIAELDKTFPNAYSVTAACVGCHTSRGAEFMRTQHWNWKGPTPQLFPLKDFLLDPAGVALNTGAIGKTNVINNFCVSVKTNEKRCEQCHAGYGGDPDATKTQKSARAYTAADSSIPLANRIDCLICHSALVKGDMKGSYVKSTGAAPTPGFGLPTATSDLKAAAASLRAPTRDNCGFCHFNAGGADSVKIMSTALVAPDASVDVHMGTVASAGHDMTCADCHAGADHKVKGGSVYTPTNTSRLGCEECHGAAPHANTTLNDHVATIACQTCHIPAFARGKAIKVDWDWSTAGKAMTAAAGGGEVTSTTMVPGETVATYNPQKGDFVWAKNVTPAYAWYNGNMVHVTTMDKGVFGEMGKTTANRITLAAPLGSRGNGKIFPFKLMTGRQAVYVDDANLASFVITPGLFGPATVGAFWGVQGQPTYQTRVNAGVLEYATTVAPPAVPADADWRPVDGMWTTAFARGSGATGSAQLATTQTMQKSDGTTVGWQWRYTQMYMDLNHEVAPKAAALGNSCADCHSAAPKIPLCDLYAGAPASELPWGVTCP